MKLTRQRNRDGDVRMESIRRISNKWHGQSWRDDQRRAWRQRQPPIIRHPNQPLLSRVRLVLLLAVESVALLRRLRVEWLWSFRSDCSGHEQQKNQAPTAQRNHLQKPERTRNDTNYDIVDIRQILWCIDKQVSLTHQPTGIDSRRPYYVHTKLTVKSFIFQLCLIFNQK